jgi:hypothetical protein
LRRGESASVLTDQCAVGKGRIPEWGKRVVNLDHLLLAPAPLIYLGSPAPCFGARAAGEKIVAPKLPTVDDWLWPGRAKAKFKLAAVNQSSKVGQQGKF